MAKHRRIENQRWAEEMLDEQNHRADVPSHVGTAHEGLPQKRLKEDLS